MYIDNYVQFGQDLINVLGLRFESFSEKKWEKFLIKYFEPEILKNLQTKIDSDICFFQKKDPASKDYKLAQILSIRRGMIAIVAHRIFQEILKKNSTKIFEIEVIAKFIQTGTNVEIHPKANLESPFAIDHGHGTVIGETTITNSNIFCYHNVTLGASNYKSKTKRRHPKLGSNIFLGNGSQILGPSILDNNISVGSKSMILDSIIENDVIISPNVFISKVIVPSGMKVFANLPLDKKYLIKEKNESTTTVKNLEEINIREYY